VESPVGGTADSVGDGLTSNEQMSTALSTTAGSAASQLGERVRALRIAAGLTQAGLAGARCSKEYISQIERGKTRPTPETIDWLAARLGADPSFVAFGVSADERARIETMLARAEALSEAHREDEAIAEFRAARELVGRIASPELELRALSGEGWALAERGDVGDAIDVLAAARALTEAHHFSDVDRADVLFRLGVCRYKLSSISTAIGLLDEALALAERSGLPCDLLRADILGWRSRCRRRQRDFEAAQEDVERALELAQAMDDRRVIANTFFQASLVAERMGHWIQSRSYAQQAKALYQELNDRRNVGRLMLNLGGLHLLLGKPEHAIEHLKASFALAIEADSQPDAAQALGGLATVHLHLGDYESAEEQARKALELLDGREDFLHEIGPSSLVLGRALMETGRLEEAEECFKAAEDAAERLQSVSHRAGAWVALGDLASRRGDDREAARLFRNAAEALQDIRF
jgi:tetratricopeptide (TPR) repeat protein